MIQVSETFRRVAERRGLLSEGLMERIAREGTLAHIREIPEDVRAVFVCAHRCSEPFLAEEPFFGFNLH